jgi:hypothetical protein
VVPRLARAFAVKAGRNRSAPYLDIAHAILVYDIAVASPLVSSLSFVCYFFGSNWAYSIRNVYLLNKG